MVHPILDEESHFVTKFLNCRALTYMATLLELVASGDLVKIEVELEGTDQPWRVLYGTPEFINWLEKALPELETTVVGGDIEPDEQVYACFYDYIVGEDLDPDVRFKKLRRTPDLHVWELKTIDVRIFGWIPQKDVFICCFGDLADTIKLRDSYSTYMARTEYVRAQINLDEPKSIESRNYDDVLSNAS